MLDVKEQCLQGTMSLLFIKEGVDNYWRLRMNWKYNVDIGDRSDTNSSAGIVIIDIWTVFHGITRHTEQTVYSKNI